ncbi:MAG: glycosyltransferase family 2 protein [Minisyncoccales bacterium]
MEKEMPEISIVLPCQNEEQALPFCLRKIKEIIEKNKLSAEIIVSDSSFDKSPAIAQREGVILVKHDQPGYGRALLEGFKKARGKYIFFADADGTYDFSEIPRFIEELKRGYDLVIGNRFTGRMEKNSMPFLRKYIGNPFFSFLFKFFFGIKIKDPHSGIRALKKEILKKLDLQTNDMEFASEMIIKAKKNNLKIKEISTSYFCRKGRSKLKNFAHGWQHLKLILVYSPFFIFFLPGILLLFSGFFFLFYFYFFSPYFFGIKFFYHPMFIFSLMVLIGYQLIFFALFAKIYSLFLFKEKNKNFEKILKFLTIEKGIFFGLFFILFGLLIYLFVLSEWLKFHFSPLLETKRAIIGFTFISLGVQTIFSSFMLSILLLKKNDRDIH